MAVLSQTNTSIQFENRQARSKIQFVLNNGTLPDKPMMLGASIPVFGSTFYTHTWLGVPVVEGVDTRRLTRHLRERGAMRAILSTLDLDEASLVKKANGAPNMAGLDLVTSTSVTEPYRWGLEGPYGTMPADTGVIPAQARFRVVAFFADVALWETDVDRWRALYGESLLEKATTNHAVAYDMRTHQADTTRATEALHRAITDLEFPHNGDLTLKRHFLNARRRPNRWGTSFGKESRESPKKVDAVAAKFTDQVDRLTELQNDLLSNGGFEFVDDVEQSAVKLRTFIDRVKTAPRGYAGVFDAVQVKEDQLDQLYNFDYQLLSEADNLAAAIDQCRIALGVTPAPPPAEGAAPAATGPEALGLLREYPIGAIMTLETGGDGGRFAPKAVQGTSFPAGKLPEKLILDGQQRLRPAGADLH